MITLLIALVLVCPVLIVLLRSYEYEGEDKLVAITSALLHLIFSGIFCLALLIAIMAIFA